MPEFAIRVSSLDSLFDEYDARPIAERPLLDAVHDHLLDAWERVRDSDPKTLTVYAPEAERSRADAAAIRAAISNDLRASCGPLRSAGPLARRERIGVVIGIVFLISCIAISTAIERATDDVVAEAVAQGITLVGWVALWRPAEHLVNNIVPHRFNRRRYREFADVDVRIAWV
jgi:hypothetical protein